MDGIMTDKQILDKNDKEQHELYCKMNDSEKDEYMTVRLICKRTHHNGGNMKEAILHYSEISGISPAILEEKVKAALRMKNGTSLFEREENVRQQNIRK